MKNTFSNKNQFVLNLLPFSECGILYIRVFIFKNYTVHLTQNKTHTIIFVYITPGEKKS